MNPDAILGALPQISAIVEKGGIIGLLVIICGFLLWREIQRTKEIARVYRERDRWRLAYTIVKVAADQAQAKYDLRDLADLVDAPQIPAT